MALLCALPALGAMPRVWAESGLRGVRAGLEALEGPVRLSGQALPLYRQDLPRTRGPSGEPVGRWPGGRGEEPGPQAQVGCAAGGGAAALGGVFLLVSLLLVERWRMRSRAVALSRAVDPEEAGRPG